MKKYNMRKIMKRAWNFVKKTGMSISDALKASWKEAKYMAIETKNVLVSHFESYNARRYSTPWVCEMDDKGNHNFSQKVGTFTGSSGEEGDLVIFRPVIGKVYGWGQKDYRSTNTIKNYIKWNGFAFSKCDKLGNEI